MASIQRTLRARRDQEKACKLVDACRARRDAREQQRWEREQLRDLNHAEPVCNCSTVVLAKCPSHNCLVSLRQTVVLVALLNLAYFGVEFGVAVAIASVSLFADSIDFLEDASVNLLIAVALSWTAKQRAKVGMLLAAVLLVPGLATLWTAWTKFNVPSVPAPTPLSVAALGAAIINMICALLLMRFRSHSGSLTRAAFLSARNDVVANIAIIIVGGITAVIASAWPDLLLGIGIAAMNADAAHEVWEAARGEHCDAEA